jgi:hypothetical protein
VGHVARRRGTRREDTRCGGVRAFAKLGHIVGADSIERMRKLFEKCKEEAKKYR